MKQFFALTKKLSTGDVIMDAAIRTLVRAVIAPTNIQARQFAWQAELLCSSLTPAQVKRCKAIAQTIVKSQCAT